MVMPWGHGLRPMTRIASPRGRPSPAWRFRYAVVTATDFYAVTDHAMFLGLAKASAETVTEFSKNDFAAPYHGLNDPHNYDTDFFSMIKRLGTLLISSPVPWGVFDQAT